MNLNYKCLFFLFFIVFFLNSSIEARLQRGYNYNPYFDKYRFFLSGFAYVSNNQQQGEGVEIMYRLISPLHIGFSLYKANLENSKFLYNNYDFWNESFKNVSITSNKKNPAINSFKLRYFPFEFGFYIGTSLRISESFQEVYFERYYNQTKDLYNLQNYFEQSIYYKKNFGNFYGISMDIGLYNIFPQKWWNFLEFGIIGFCEVSFQQYRNSRNQLLIQDFFVYKTLKQDQLSLQFLQNPILLYSKLESIKNKKSFLFQKENISFRIGIGIAR
ncbi:MAG: hypothetical protein N2247_05760 [Leptospiraceae bacterium]|nr:hypothetical protein [Leptospiraceae bacterium]